MQHVFSILVIIYLAVELYFCSAGSAHKKKRITKGWNPVKGKIRKITSNYDSLAHKTMCELTIKAEDGGVCYAKVSKMFNQYEEGEEVELMELNGVHRFLGCDRVNKKARKELAIGLIPLAVILALLLAVSIFTQ